MRFPKLKEDQQRGSKPRCHLYTDGGRAEVAGRLSYLVKPYGSVCGNEHQWLPAGFNCVEEVQLHKPNCLIAPEKSRELCKWWFNKPAGSSPSWDIASQCTIGSDTGILLVEAKAHVSEIDSEGKPEPDATPGSRLNHQRIREAIEEANDGLGVLTLASGALTHRAKGTSMQDVTDAQGWTLSRDCCYQLANRLAWAWKLASIGIPVVLVYLAFLNADEVSDLGDPFHELADWIECVKKHAKGKVPEGAWNRGWETSNGTLFVPRIMAIHQSLTAARMSC